jgi:hypothetical protein
MTATTTMNTDNLNSFEAEDGISHINIKNTGRTLLGRTLALETKHPFRHPEFGEFKSLEAFWYYIKSGCQNTEVRNVSGGAGRHLVTPGNSPEGIANFQNIITDGMYHWLTAFHRDDLSEVLFNRLPLDMYYIFRGKSGAATVQRPSFYRWYIPRLTETIELIRLQKPCPETDYGDLLKIAK